jgi:hypothetical protein
MFKYVTLQCLMIFGQQEGSLLEIQSLEGFEIKKKSQNRPDPSASGPMPLFT